MLVIKVWCLPKMTEKQLNELHKSIVAAVASVKELGLKNEAEMTCLFPLDMMFYGPGKGIIIEVTNLSVRPQRAEEVRQRLAMHLGDAVRRMYPNALVECLVSSLDPAQGFWSSRSKSLSV